MNILGINAYHADAAAALLVDGRLVAAVEEERLRRIKHWAGFPAQAIGFCLEHAGLTLADVDAIAVNRDPGAYKWRKLAYGLRRRPRLRAVAERLRNANAIAGIAGTLAQAFGADAQALAARLHRVEHHRAHLASAFYVSPFDEAAIVSVDGFGDFVSTMWGQGCGNRIDIGGRVRFPHSLGLFYLAATQHLGFLNYGDEYKVMGLSACGQPRRNADLGRVVPPRVDGTFTLDTTFFRHCRDGIAMSWPAGAPVIAPVYSECYTDLFGPARAPDEPIEERHRDLAASVQAVYEQRLFALLRRLHDDHPIERLCLAGGCAMNSLANGKIPGTTPFKRLFVQPAAGDAGGALGAAYALWHEVRGNPRGFVLERASYGPSFSPEEIAGAIRGAQYALDAEGCRCLRVDEEEALCIRIARDLADGAIVGWFQGGMEWGPRALGNRSILCDPRRRDAKEVLNAKIKRREAFRPFAPSILRDHVGAWFDGEVDVPFMTEVLPVRSERRNAIPAVVHVDGTARAQTVAVENNPLYHRLIEAFYRITGVPMVLNTSFNENEPIVCRPEEAIECFLRTQIDILALGPFIIERSRT